MIGAIRKVIIFAVLIYIFSSSGVIYSLDIEYCADMVYPSDTVNFSGIINSDILVNDNYSGYDQSNPRVAVSNSGDFTVIWTDKRYGYSYIFFQPLDSTGTPLGYNLQLNDDYLAIPHVAPAIDVSIAGEFVGTWKDYRNGNYPFGPDIYYSTIDTFPTPPNHIVTVVPPELLCESPDIAVFQDGTSIVVWSDYRYNRWDIFGQRIDTAGQLLGGFFRVNSDVGNNQQHSPRVTILPNDDFIVVWYDNRNGHDDIYAQRFNSAANPIGQNILVNDDGGETRQAFPAVAADGNGRFFIAWVDWINGNYPENPDIYLKRYDSSAAAINSAFRVSSDNYGRTQKNVNLCSDYMGNICVVWADSSSGQWDAMAQIVGPDGILLGDNFILHNDTIGKQLQPDVATDGYKFYFVWADSRNGDFDIYATIKKYNEPALIPDPGTVTLNMEQGGSIPAPVSIAIDNAGYGSLNWAVSPTTDWISVNPLSGATPDTFEIYVATDTLTYGTHYSGVRLIDLDHNDSSRILPVILNVTAPTLAVNPDTLYFKVLAEMGNPDSRKFQISNSGSGTLNWTADEYSNWFSIDVNSGTQSQYVTVRIDISGLLYGDYFEPLIISSVEAVNSPETAWVHLELVGNMSYLEVRPDSVIFRGYQGESFSSQLEIVNRGAGSLNWTAVENSNWLHLDKYSGSDYDTIFVTLDTSTLTTGYYQTEILIYDSASFNGEVIIPVELFLSSGDTVQFFNTNAMPGGVGVMPVYVYLIDSAKGGYIPFGFDVSTAALDSIGVNSASMPSFVDFYTNVYTSKASEIGFYINDSTSADSTIPPGNYHIANLFFSTANSDAFNRVDTMFSDSSGSYILKPNMNKKIPTIIDGDLIIGNPTSVEEENIPILPESPELCQNYPNPFNASTNIEISLPRSTDVTVDIYNILGQNVYSLYNGYLSYGNHLLNWDGYLQNGLSAPSGIYFCRMAAGSTSEVKKMVLLR